jgi:polar amino acid transport system permease protein
VESFMFKGYEAFTAATLIYLGISLAVMGLVNIYNKKVLTPVGGN